MSEEAGVTIPITAEDSFSSVFSDFVEQSSEITSSVGEITSSTEDLSSASQSMTGSFEEATTSAQDYSSSAQNVVTTNSEMSASQEETSTTAAETGSSFKETSGQIAGAAGTVGMATIAAVGLNDAYVRLQDSQLRYNTALANEKKDEEMLTADKQKLTDAQDKLNALKQEGITSGTKYTVAEQGVANAEQTVANAQTTLSNSQNTVTQAQNKLGIANEQVQTQWLMMGTSVIPMILTQLPTFASMLGLTGGATDALTASQEAEAGSTGIASAATALWNAVLDANPIGLVVIAIVGLIAVIGIVTDGFKNWTPLINVGNDALNVFKVILGDVETGFTDLYNTGHVLFDFFMQMFGTDIKTWETALQDLWNLIQPIVKGVQDISGGISSVTGAISGGGSSVTGAISGGINALTHLASGGIVTQPTPALIGESGPEAVIPLADVSTQSVLSPVMPDMSQAQLSSPTPQVNISTTNAQTSSPQAAQSTFNQTVNFDVANIDATSDYDWQQNIQKQLVKAAGAVQSTI